MILKPIIALGALGVVATGVVIVTSTTSVVPLERRAIMQTDGDDTSIYPTILDASIISNIPEDTIRQCVLTGRAYQGLYFESLK